LGIKVLQEEVAAGKLDADVVAAFLCRESDIKEIKKAYGE
jgi:CRISPR/Cas system-associated protein Csm6